MARFIGPLTWAYCILVGSYFLITPEGIGPIVFTIVGVVGVGLGLAGFFLGRARVPAAAG